MPSLLSVVLLLLQFALSVRSAICEQYGQLFEKRFLLINCTLHSSDQNDSLIRIIENKSIQTNNSTRAKQCSFFRLLFVCVLARVAAVSMNSKRAKITTLASQSQTRICDVCANVSWATQQRQSAHENQCVVPNSFCAFEINQVVRSKSHFVQLHDDSNPSVRREIFNTRAASMFSVRMSVSWMPMSSMHPVPICSVCFTSISIGVSLMFWDFALFSPSPYIPTPISFQQFNPYTQLMLYQMPNNATNRLHSGATFRMHRLD